MDLGQLEVQRRLVGHLEHVGDVDPWSRLGLLVKVAVQEDVSAEEGENRADFSTPGVRLTCSIWGK